MAELKQTKNSFKFIGKVSRIDKDGAFKQEEATRGKKQGETYRALRFGVKTSGTNEMTVQMYDFKPDEVFLWNSDKKKKDKNYKGDRVAFDKWVKNEEEFRENGFAVLQTRIGLSYGEDGKLQTKGVPSFVASKQIFDALSNGDSVVVEGEIRYSKYKNQQDKEVEQKTFTIKKLYKLGKEVDFEAENFEEITYFEQQFVFVDAEDDTEAKKVYVTGRVIDFTKNFHDTQFVINYADAEGNVDKEMKKLADAFKKKMKFGDLLNVYGDAVNRVITQEVAGEEEESEEDELLKSLGGKKKPQHAQQYTARTYVSEMQIHGVEAWDKGVYEDEDFVKDDLLEEEETNKKNPFQDELGGKSKKNNPFEVDDNDIDIDDEDLPF